MSFEEESQLTRASLLEQLTAREPAIREEAWSEFCSRYVPVIAGFARRCGANQQDVDDIVQEVLTSFYSKGSDFSYDRSRGRFRGFLKTVTVRVALRRAGKNLRYRGMPFENVPEIELAVDSIWNDVWEQQLVSRGLEVLRQESGDSVAFRAFEQYVLLDRSADIVAAELGVSVNHVHQSKSRLTKRLREVVQDLRATDF